MVWFLQLLGSLNTTEIVAWGVDNVAGGVIVGGFILLISTIVTVYFIEKKRESRQIKREEEIEKRRIIREEESRQKEKLEQEKNKKTIFENEKRSVSASLLSEIERNQKLLQPISDSVPKALDSNNFSDDDKLPDRIIFESGIYSTLLGKLGALNDDCRNRLVQYYSELKHIEDHYKKFQLIHDMPYSFLVVLELKDKSNKWNYGSPFWSETEKFIRHTKEVFELGEELMIGLKEKADIKYSNVPKEPLEHLQIKTPDIRKLWTDCEKLKIKISEEKKKMREYIKNQSKDGVPLYSKLDKIFDMSYISQNKWGEIVNRTEGEEICGFVDDFATTGKLTKDEEYKEFVELIIKDKPLYEIFESVRENKINLNKKIKEYDILLQKMEKIDI